MMPLMILLLKFLFFEGDLPPVQCQLGQLEHPHRHPHLNLVRIHHLDYLDLDHLNLDHLHLDPIMHHLDPDQAPESNMIRTSPSPPMTSLPSPLIRKATNV